jgi:hypothetical protein
MASNHDKEVVQLKMVTQKVRKKQEQEIQPPLDKKSSVDQIKRVICLPTITKQWYS